MPNPETNLNSHPNPNLKWEAIFLGINCMDILTAATNWIKGVLEVMLEFVFQNDLNQVLIQLVIVLLLDYHQE